MTFLWSVVINDEIMISTENSSELLVGLVELRVSLQVDKSVKRAMTLNMYKKVKSGRIKWVRFDHSCKSVPRF